MRTIKTTVHRFQKDTIKKSAWFIHVEETEGKFTLWKGLLRMDDYHEIKKVHCNITKEEAEKIISENKDYHIETYERNVNIDSPNMEYVEKFADKMFGVSHQDACYWVDGIGGMKDKEKYEIFEYIKLYAIESEISNPPLWL
jgi:hypothetical protein